MFIYLFIYGRLILRPRLTEVRETSFEYKIFQECQEGAGLPNIKFGPLISRKLQELES